MTLADPQCAQSMEAMATTADFATRCETDCARELADCIDDPVLAASRDAIMPILDSCVADVSAEIGAGDGICQMVNMAQMCPMDGLEADIVAMCESGCLSEALDCTETMHMSAEDQANFQSMALLCENQECTVLLQAMGDEMVASHCYPAGCEEGMHCQVNKTTMPAACIPQAEQTQRRSNNPPGPLQDDLPATCGHECAAMFVPFAEQCGDAVRTMMAAQPDMVAEFGTFSAQCTAAYTDTKNPGGRGAGGGH